MSIGRGENTARVAATADMLSFMKNRFRLACPTLLLVAALAPAADDPVLRGYAPASARAEHDWEVMFRATPSPQNLHDYMQRLSARPHHVGSPYDKDNAEWMLSKFKEWGLDAHIETFEVLFPSPKSRLLEMVAPAGALDASENEAGPCAL